MPTKRSSPRLRIIISSDIDISETSNSAKLSCRQNISAGPRIVLMKSMPSALTRPSMIGRVRGLLVMARLSCRLAMFPPGRILRFVAARRCHRNSLGYPKKRATRSARARGGRFRMASLRYDFRTAIVGALALGLAAPVSAAAAADMALTVGKANATSDAIIPVNVGDKLGIFKKHGLDLTITDFGGGGKMAQAM